MERNECKMKALVRKFMFYFKGSSLLLKNRAGSRETPATVTYFSCQLVTQTFIPNDILFCSFGWVVRWFGFYFWLITGSILLISLWVLHGFASLFPQSTLTCMLGTGWNVHWLWFTSLHHYDKRLKPSTHSCRLFFSHLPQIGWGSCMLSSSGLLGVNTLKMLVGWFATARRLVGN